MPLVTLRSYRDAVEAELDRALLDASDVPCVVCDANLASMFWHYSNAIGGVKLEVDESDRDRAEEVLNLARVAACENTGDAPQAEGDLCPRCGSSDVHRSRLHRWLFALSIGIGFPLLAWHRASNCEACGHSWKPAVFGPLELPKETRIAEEAVHERNRYRGVGVLLIAFLLFAVLVYIDATLPKFRP